MKSCSALTLIFLCVTLLVASFVVFYPLGYLYATYENLYGEWMQFAAFVGIAWYSGRIVWRRRSWRDWFWLLLGIAALYVALEEISWGQQFFDWESPEFFQKHNLQGETNLHNMLTGPYSTLLKDVLTWMLLATFIAYGVVYPLMYRAKVGLAQWAESIGVPVPSLCLLPYFVLFVICEAGLFHFNEAEIAELILSLALCFMSASYFYRHVADEPLDDEQLGKRFLQITVAAVVASIGLTFASMHGPNKRGIENRIEAGIKKFAGRYERREVWHHAIDLYEKHLALKPDSRSRMRRLASAYRDGGQIGDQEALLNRALQLDLDKLQEDTTSASLHRSLFRTYKALGNQEQAAHHINAALAINLKRLQEHPKSHNAAYSAARTFDLLGRKADALKQYERAFKLNPRSSRNRRAYRNARGH